MSGVESVWLYWAISRDGRFLVRATHDGIYFHDLRRGTVIATLPNSKPGANAIAISADGSKVAIAYSERILRIYRIADAALLQESKLQGGAISDLAWTSDGRTLVAVSSDGFLRCFSSELLELTTLIRLPSEDLHKLVLSENGDRHWQYHSIDNRNIHEFSCGPTCDEHTQAVPPLYDGVEQPYSATRGGFMGVLYQPNDCSITFNFYSVTGELLYQKIFKK